MSSGDYSNISTAFDAHWQEDTTELSKLNTVRLDNGSLNPNVLKCRDYIFNSASSFNESQKNLKFRTFQWCKTGTKENRNPEDSEILDAEFAVFGLRVGSDLPDPEYKMVVICHLDVVPADPDSTVWDPFEPKVEFRQYEHGTEEEQDFLVGRGCVDDKGPAASCFVAARCVAKAFDELDLGGVQIELLFDSSEETSMSTPHYLEGEGTVLPDFGIVYDAFWCVRAEKGGERPEFWVDPGRKDSQNGVYTESLITSQNNSTNTIPDYCDVVFAGSDVTEVTNLAGTIERKYQEAVFDDPAYNKARIDPPVMSNDRLSFSIRAYVEGAQHGSAPEQNRAEGANPLISLANFVNWLLCQGTITSNHVSTMSAFIASTWGTHVFGEAHESLYKYDDVFTKDNGTSYAVTKTVMDPASGRITLSIDIRYAIPHHEEGWDGVTEGFLPGNNSIFRDVFGDIISSFNCCHMGWDDVSFDTSTIFGPDIRSPETNKYLQSVEKSFNKVMGYNPPRFAIGGGTDAKGYTFLCGAGPLFNPSMGDPINYHGLNEGAPMADMKKSTEILFQSIVDQIESPITDRHQKSRNMKALHFMRSLREKHGLKMVCRH